MKLNSKGFSLTELMMVVSIIGVLTMLAVPQYKTYQAKARQAEATTLLSSYYAAAQSALSEQRLYPGNFLSTGFAPKGIIHYRITAVDNSGSLATGILKDTACIVTSNACSATVANFKSWTEDTTTKQFQVAAPVSSAAATTNTTFTAVASGVISTTGISQWNIDQTKTLTMVTAGF